MKFQDEYSNPLLYDAEYGSYLPDGPFFESLLTSNVKTILDLACGTGRLTIPLAQKGFHVSGVEILDSMLNLAREKSSKLSINWVQGDCRNTNLNQTFDLIIMGGNAFQAMLTKQDQRQLVETVKKHLAPHGWFAFNMRTLTALKHESRISTYWHTFTDQKEDKIDVYGYVRFDEKTGVGTYITERRHPNKTTRSQISLKFTPFEGLKSLLEEGGLKVAEAWGSANKMPYDEMSESIYVVCCLQENQ